MSNKYEASPLSDIYHQNAAMPHQAKPIAKLKYIYCAKNFVYLAKI